MSAEVRPLDDDEILAALQTHYSRPPNETVILEHLQALRSDPARRDQARATQSPHNPPPQRPWRLLVGVSVLVIALAGAVIQLSGDGPNGQVETSDDPLGSTTIGPPSTPPPTAGDRLEVDIGETGQPDVTGPAVGPEVNDSEEPSQDGTPDSVADGPTLSTTVEQPAQPATSAAGTTTTTDPAVSETGAAPETSTAPGTNAAPPDAQTTTSEPQTVTTTPTTFQTNLIQALRVTNACLEKSGYLFVGMPGQSDHPLSLDVGYQAALVLCDQQSEIGPLIGSHISWQIGLTEAEKLTLQQQVRPVFECVTTRSWDIGELLTIPNGITFFSRFPQVPASRTDQFATDLARCGWYSLDLDVL